MNVEHLLNLNNHRKLYRTGLLLLSLLSLLLLADTHHAFVTANNGQSSIVLAGNWQHKVAPAVLEQTAVNRKTQFILLLHEQADLSGTALLPTKEAKGRYVFEQLTAVSRRSQAPIRSQLDVLQIPHQSFWITNMLLVEGDATIVANMARRSDVARVLANTAVSLDAPTPQPISSRAPAAIEWGVTKINADDVWAIGYTGQGVVVAGQDTGYDWDHPALQDKYRGWDSVNNVADHNYHWHDAIHGDNPNTSAGNPCGFSLQAPCDDHGHGTHTLGTMIGDDGGNNQVGVAPDAKWIACRNMESGWGTPTTYAECFQWFLAPTALDGSNPDPSKAPHVINNSWSCPTSEGCIDPAVLQTVVENTRAAGIFVVASAGNTGPSCSSIHRPAAIYNASFTIGSTSNSDSIASSSSRGPVTVDGSSRFKPDVTAPGVSIRSSTNGGSYGYSSGTSMAGPHVAGAVALLISADPSLAGQVDKLEQILRNSAVPLTSTQTCGTLSGSQSPNYTFGYGRIDALAAVNYALSPPVAAAPAPTLTLNNGQVVLDWPNNRNNCQYKVFRSDNAPYFTPTAVLQIGMMWADSTIHTDGSLPNPIGDATQHAYYQVQGIGCGGETAVSPTLGEFEFEIEPGN